MIPARLWVLERQFLGFVTFRDIADAWAVLEGKVGCRGDCERVERRESFPV